MVAAVGARPSGPFYVNGDGNYNTIVVTSASATAADIVIDSRQILGADISNGLIIEEGSNRSTFFFNEIQIDAAITQDIDIRASKSNHLRFTGGPANFVVNTHGGGTLNNNVTFEGITRLFSEGFEDQVVVDDGGYVANINTDSGDDTVTILTGLLRMPNVNLGSGDDHIIVDGFGDGGTLVGGSGSDTASSTLGGFLMQSGGSNFGMGFQRYSSIENIVGAPGSDSTFRSYFSTTNLRVDIDGNEATVYRIGFGTPSFLHRLTNFNTFDLSTRHRQSEIVVRNTAFELNLQAGRSITVSSTDDLQQSELSGVRHEIRVTGGDPDLIVSNRLSPNPLSVMVEGRSVSGMTSEPIRTTHEFRNIILHGSDLPDNFLLVGPGHLGRSIYGYNGSDIFSVGDLVTDMDFSHLVER